MKKVLILVLLMLFGVGGYAVERSDDELLSFISNTPYSVSQQKVAHLLGAPAKIEDGRKRVLWHYRNGNTDLVISWNKRSEVADKFSFRNTVVVKPDFDNALSRKLKSGQTDIEQALQLLGTPRDMVIKPTKQEMHYAYNNKVLRLFFRDRKLVDFCLY